MKMTCFRVVYERKKAVVLCLTVYVFVCFLVYSLLSGRPVSPRRDIVEDDDDDDNDGSDLRRSLVGDERSVAIGGGLTSRNLIGVNETNMADKFIVHSVFLQTFCRTASTSFNYHFYFAYDRDDAVFTTSRLADAFRTTFRRLVAAMCPRGLRTSIRLVRCDHARNPTWAQNDAMLEAYLDNMEYFYRINDDTKMATAGWTEAFVDALEKYDPPRVGVVCPTHSGGNTGICTYDFVHRTHIDVFGFYYPRLFTDWWGDDWITRVYQPGRSTKLAHIHVTHTISLGQRYDVRWSTGNRLEGQLKKDIETLTRYDYRS